MRTNPILSRQNLVLYTKINYFAQNPKMLNSDIQKSFLLQRIKVCKTELSFVLTTLIFFHRIEFCPQK
jgi:hypothetical protein